MINPPCNKAGPSARLLGEYAERLDLGEVRGSRSAVKLAEDQIYQPDVLFVSRDRLSLFERQGIFGPPDLVVEILSRSTASYDRGAKLRTYDRTGVREVWLIDPAGPQGTEILQRQGRVSSPWPPDQTAPSPRSRSPASGSASTGSGRKAGSSPCGKLSIR